MDSSLSTSDDEQPAGIARLQAICGSRYTRRLVTRSVDAQPPSVYYPSRHLPLTVPKHTPVLREWIAAPPFRYGY